MTNLTSIFGTKVFSDAIMCERLPKATYKALMKTLDIGEPLDADVAEVVASVMKDWAIEQGATHYTHWFQPMTGITAEKHDSFINPTTDGKMILEFSGKELIKGEPDASSFPNGGLRDTYEARGYTAWDCTSPAFVKDDTLCIPTAFMSYTGVALDKKTPLLRSMEAISKQALRVLKLFGNESVKKVVTTVGPEQEYFLVDKTMYEKRNDLIYTGRTLFGSPPPKGQELDDHYFGSIKERVVAYMKDLDNELWKLGISAKTRHNEVAPSQHELATVFTTTNKATDNNQLVMETMKKIALRHNLVCLLHEKPFAGVNGSGKHNNWSMATDTGINLLEPGETPHENVQFLVFLSAVIKAVDEFAPVLRLSAANPGNDHRLGANEAPPAIISIFLGNQLTEILQSIAYEKEYNCKSGECIELGVTTLPQLPKDATDRNRTSPFAFTGNKFEFRMCPSSGSIAGPNFTLNTIVAEILDEFAKRLEEAKDLNIEVTKIVSETYKEHERIIFNGNNYSDEWLIEAKNRGLPNYKSMVEACKSFIEEKTVNVFEKHGVLRKEEIYSRYEILLETYAKTINIEALTTLEMAKKQILPAAMKSCGNTANELLSLKNSGVKSGIKTFSKILENKCSLVDSLSKSIETLEDTLQKAQNLNDEIYEFAFYYRKDVISAMDNLRKYADELEKIVDKKLWPFPTYGDLLFKV